MKALLNIIKNLPPEVRSLLAMAGLGSFAGIIYLMSSKLGMSVFHICIAMLVVSTIIGLGAMVISKGFSFRSRSRARRMADDLGKSAESGPSSMDARAAIKANNEKFFSAIREMRKGLGVNVYDLPWYIVIGDSGCGKTKLVNEGGLTFSAGKPEGYQLGTLNYNWWFTEDAVFIDMAGRLVNPQDDADRREWLAFLDTVATGRRGFPINGTLVCVSAEHLLEDSPEKQEADANNMLERLRDLQTRLGVTFGTYLLVTKCDKMLGFMQFFDRAERDITMKNQIFGWSKPGDFNELYNPERFGTDFDGVYSRLNDLRIRRVNDDADEVELGLAYAFPEEFRELREPLEIYVRTLFPMIKNPRAIKNLVFRGVYFTSATQQGGLILKHLTTRLGADAASQFGPLESLYPQPRPHFVKDLLFKKVFPEHGLVFRNEQQVQRHRRLAKILLYSSFVGFAVLMGILGWSCNVVGVLIENPQKHVNQIRAMAPDAAPSILGGSPGANESGLQALKADQDHLRDKKWVARVLSLGIGADAPIKYLETIQRELFRRYVVARAIRDVEDTLQKPPGGRLTDANHEAFEKALLGYLQWVSAADPMTAPPGGGPVAASAASMEYEKNPLWQWLKSYAPGGKPEEANQLVSNMPRFAELWNDGRDSSGDKSEKSLPRLTAPEAQWSSKNALTVTKAAVAVLYDYYEPYARLDESPDKSNADPIIREWMRVRKECENARTAYGEILDSNNGLNLTSVEAYTAYLGKLGTSMQRFTEASARCLWGKETRGKAADFKSLRDALCRHYVDWNKIYSDLKAACTMASSDGHLGALQRLHDDPNGGLNTLLQQRASKYNKGATTQPADASVTSASCPYVQEVTDAYGFLVRRLEGVEGAKDSLALTPQAQRVQNALKGVQSQLKNATTSRPSVQFLPDWNRHLDGLLKPPATKQPQDSLGTLDPPWRQPDLEKFLSSIEDTARRGQLGATLALLSRHFDDATRNDWGLASMERADYLGCLRSSFRMIGCGEAAAPVRTSDSAAPTESSGRRQSRRTPRTNSSLGTPGQRPSGVASQIPNAATRDFLYNTFADAGDLTAKLADLRSDDYVGEPQLSQTLLSKLDSLRARYLEKYFAEWKIVHDNCLVAFSGLKSVEQATDWRGFRQSLRKPSAAVEVATQLRFVCAELYEHVMYADHEWAGGSWETDRAELVRIREDKWKPITFHMEAFHAAPQLADKPWEDLAGKIEQGWLDFARKLGGYEDFSQQFSDPKFNRSTTPIKEWVIVSEETIRTAVGGMHPLDKLLEISESGRVLLDEEIHRVLLGRQTTLLGQMNVELPYKSEADKFAQFVEETTTARKYFDPVDDKLKRSDSRVEFYVHCQDWKTLFGDVQRWTPLGVRIALKQNFRTAPNEFLWKLILPSPTGTAAPPPTGPQNSYGELQLWLGLEPVKGGAPTEIKFLFDAEKGEQESPLEWRWPATAAQQCQLALAGGGTIIKDWPRVQQVLGPVGKLSLLQLLQENGSPATDRKEWRVGVSWDLCAVLKANKAAEAAKCADLKQTYVGTALVFKLDRPLPVPFAPLVPTPVAPPRR